MFGRTRNSGFGFLDVSISREILELEVGEAPPTLSTEQFRGIISSAAGACQSISRHRCERGGVLVGLSVSLEEAGTAW